MYEQSNNFWDIAIVTVVICAAAFYVYKKLFHKKSKGCGSGGGCDSCPSSVKNRDSDNRFSSHKFKR